MSKLLFRKDDAASWEIRQHLIIEGDTDVFAYHIECHPAVTSEWLRGWYLSMGHLTPVCYTCKCPVPDYIQALVLLYAS